MLSIPFDDKDDFIPLGDISARYSTSKAITPDEPIEEPDNSLSMGDEHLDTIPKMESDEVIKSSVENLVQTPSESEGIPEKGIPDNMCDVPFCDNSPPLDISKDQFEDFSDSNDDSTLSDDDSYENIDYVDASPPDSELVSLEEVKDFHTEDGEIEDDILREKLSKINLLIAKIEAINSNPPPSSKISSGSTTTRSDYSLSDYEAFYLDDDHIEEKSSDSTTTHAYFSQYDSFIFDLLIYLFPPADRSDFYHE
ncbi:hypothetical protein Tco_1544777 [Tanacetum coccineum]